MLSINSTLIGNIKQLRKEMNLAQKELAEKANIDRSSLSRIETGNQDATLAQLEAISEVFSVPVSSLLINSTDDPLAGMPKTTVDQYQQANHRARRLVDHILLLSAKRELSDSITMAFETMLISFQETRIDARYGRVIRETVAHLPAKQREEILRLLQLSGDELDAWHQAQDNK